MCIVGIIEFPIFVSKQLGTLVHLKRKSKSRQKVYTLADQNIVSITKTGHLDSPTSDIQNLNIRELEWEQLLLSNANEDLQFQNSKMIKCNLKRGRGWSWKFFQLSIYLLEIKWTDFSRDIPTQMERRQFQFESHHRNETFCNSILIKANLHHRSDSIEVHYNKKRSFSN